MTAVVLTSRRLYEREGLLAEPPDGLPATGNIRQIPCSGFVLSSGPKISDLRFGPIDVLNGDDLIMFKLLAGRMIDRADAAMLLRENREAIDFGYLLSWVT